MNPSGSLFPQNNSLTFRNIIGFKSNNVNS